ncbi:MAG: hypothetical protein ABEH90_00885 [Halolamina sp.]
MLTLSIADLMVELEEGTVKHVGSKTTDATAKLYHVEETDARAFGDQQVKLGFADGEGNEVEVALDRDAALAFAADLHAAAGDGESETPTEDVDERPF